MNSNEFVRRVKDVAAHYKTLYVMGCIGAPLTASNKLRYLNNHDYNKAQARQEMIRNASVDTFGFDCVCLVKSVLWGWCGDENATYGGAKYASNSVPDIGADAMIKTCSSVSTDFSRIVPGAFVWLSGHCGVYIGDGLAVECTPKWRNGVQITAVANIEQKDRGYNSRKWTKWGMLPWVDYKEVDNPVDNPVENVEKPRYHTIEDIPAFYRPSIKHLIDRGKLKGSSDDDLDLSLDMIRLLTLLVNDSVL